MAAAWPGGWKPFLHHVSKSKPRARRAIAVKAPRRRTGMDFDPHWFRHGAATRMLRDRIPVEVVSNLVGHASVTTTTSIYGHLTAEDARKALQSAGWFTGGEVAL